MKRATNMKAQPIEKKVIDHYRELAILKETLIGISDEEIGRKIPILETFLENKKQCNECIALQTCLLKTQGLESVVVVEEYDQNKFLQLQYQACRLRHQFKEEVNSAYLVYSHLPLRFFAHSMKQLAIKAEQQQALYALLSYLKSYPNTHKSVYLYGDSGCGKSYLLSAFTNELLARNIQCVYLSMPEFVREMKAAISNGTLESKIEMLKHIPVLIIDDIGAEPITAFSRDEILFPILDYRLEDKKPVFFASHMSLKSLSQHFSLTQKGDQEASKGKRIVSRISQIADEILINQ